jgi:hypothetical protein
MAKAKKIRSRSRKAPEPQAGTVARKDPGEEQESVAKALIEKLGLYEEFPASPYEGGRGKGEVESE